MTATDGGTTKGKKKKKTCFLLGLTQQDHPLLQGAWNLQKGSRSRIVGLFDSTKRGPFRDKPNIQSRAMNSPVRLIVTSNVFVVVIVVVASTTRPQVFHRIVRNLDRKKKQAVGTPDPPWSSESLLHRSSPILMRPKPALVGIRDMDPACRR